MLDERWDERDRDLAAGLRAVLERECTPAHLRVAEEAPDGRAPELEKHLRAFGLDELPDEPATLAVAAWELGRALAPVPFAETAGVRAVTARAEVADGGDGSVPAAVRSALVVDADGRGHVLEVTASPRRTTAGDLLCDAPEPAVYREAEISPEDVDRIRRLGLLLDASRLVGAAEALLALGVGYVGERRQFGRPIGAFQAVAHRLADTFVAVDGAGLLVRKAAWAARTEQGGDGAPDALFASIARDRAVHAARRVSTDVHQVMGGYGFALEYDCQLYSRRLRSWTMRRGDGAAEMAAVGRAVLDPAAREGLRHLWNNDEGLALARWAREMDGAR